MNMDPDLLEQAIQRYRSGDRQQAARTLALLIKQDPANEQAWWWLAACVETAEQKTDCYQRILRSNPLHAGARTALLDLQLGRAPADPDAVTTTTAAGTADAVDPANAPTTRLRPSGLLSRLSLLANRPVEPEVEDLMARAAQAEDAGDFHTAYDLYARAVAIDSSYAPAWLGKGSAAGRLSTPEYNGIPEFFECLARAVLSQDRLGLTLPQALSQLDPALARILAGRLHELSAAVASLAVTSSLSMRNVFAIERVRLGDCAFAVSRRMNAQSGLAQEYAELEALALDAFRHIVAGVRASTRPGRERLSLLQTFRTLLLNNLAASGLAQDPEFRKQVDSLAETA